MTRKQYLNRIARTSAQIADLGRKAESAVWDRAEAFYGLMGTFPAGKEGFAAFLASAATAAKCDESLVKQAVAVVEFRNSLTAKQREGITDWPLGKVLTLSGKLTPKQRTTLIDKGQTLNEKDLRAAKRKLNGTTKRTRQTSAEATTKLAAEIESDVRKLIAKGHDALTLAAGARLQQDRTGDVAAAILFVAANAKIADPVVK